MYICLIFLSSCRFLVQQVHTKYIGIIFIQLKLADYEVEVQM